MDKITVRTRALSQALYSLAAAGCDTIEVSLGTYAVKVEGLREGEKFSTLHIWSIAAEETEEDVGKGERVLTEEEARIVEGGKCPLCEGKPQLYKGPKKGLAILVTCDAGHTFWVPPLPFVPEYHGQHKQPLEEEKLPEAAPEIGGEEELPPDISSPAE